MGIGNIFKPGQSKDDEILYGAGSEDANKGRVAGEGSHFGQHGDSSSTATPSGTVAESSDASSTTAVKHGVPGDSQEATGYHPTGSSRTTQDPTLGERLDPTTQTTGTSSATGTSGHSGLPGGQNTGTTPLYDQYSTSRAEPGGDTGATGLRAGAGAAGAGAATYAAGHHHDPNTSTSGRTADPSITAGTTGTRGGNDPYSSSTGQTSTTAAGVPTSSTTGYGGHHTSSTSAAPVAGGVGTQSSSSHGAQTGPIHDSPFLNKIDPRVKNADLPVVGATEVGQGGTGSGGYGTSTGTGVGSSASPYTTSQTGVAGSQGTHGTSTGAYDGTSGTHDSSLTDRTRSAAPAAAGGAALGAAAGAAHHHHHDNSVPQDTRQSGTISSSVPSSGAYDSGSSPRYTDASRSGASGGTTGAPGTVLGVPESKLGASASPSSSSGLPSTSGTRTGAHTGPIGTAVSGDSSNPYSSTPIDPRVNPHGQSSDNSHHYGRDAALGGAALGAAGAGYEANKHHGSSAASGPTGSGYDPQAGTGSHVARETGIASGSGAPTGSSQPSQLTDRTGPGYEQVQTTSDPTHQHHHGRDAALGAGAAGAGGAAAYGLSRDHDQTRAAPGQASTSSSVYSQQPASQTGYSQPQGTTEPQHHYGRDAALGAGAVGATGVAAHELDDKERKRLEKEQKEAEKQHEKDVKHEQKEHDKQIKHEQKEHEKELKKEEKHHQKVVAAEEKKAEKEHEKEIKKHDKQEEKLEHQREKEIAAAEEHRRKEEEGQQEEHKKKGGLLGFLHRDKHKDEPEAERTHETPVLSNASAANQTSAGVAGASAAAPIAHYDDGHHERNRLHKEPPESVKREQEARYAEAPQSGYASQVTGGTGTTALAQGDNLPGGSHASGMGNKLDPAVADRGTTGGGYHDGAETGTSGKYRDTVTGGTGSTQLAQGDRLPHGSHTTGTGNTGGSSIVTDPHTGLPMDLSKGEHTGRGTDHLPTSHID